MNELETAAATSSTLKPVSSVVAEALDDDVRNARVGTQAQHRSHERAMSSGWICSSAGSPVHSVIRVATKPGEIAVARTPCSASSRLSEFVNAISAAFVAP